MVRNMFWAETKEPSIDKKYLDIAVPLWSATNFRKMVMFATGVPFENFLFGQNGRVHLGYSGMPSYGYWTLLALLQYYLDPRWLWWSSAPSFSGAGLLQTNSFFGRIDTSASTVASSAAANILSTILPNGFSSVMYKFPENMFDLLPNVGDNPRAKNTLKILQRYLTEDLRCMLSLPSLGLFSSLLTCMSDYLNYGTAVASFNGGKLTHMPFLNVSLGSTEFDEIQTGCWMQPVPLITLAENGLLDPKQANLLNWFYNHQYLPGRLFGEKGVVELTGYSEVVKMSDFKPTKIEKCDPLLVARLNAQGEVYGVGCGMRAISSIILLNLYTKCSVLASAGAFVPATIQDASSQIDNALSANQSEGSPSTFTPISAMPGMANVVTSQNQMAPRSTKGIDVISVPLNQAEAFKVGAAECLEEIRNAYFTSFGFFSEDKNQMSATEINARMSLTAKNYRGVTGSFFSNMIYPVLTYYADLVIKKGYTKYHWMIEEIRAVYPDFDIKMDGKVEVIDFERKSNQAERSQAIKDYAETAAVFQPQQTEEEALIRERILTELHSLLDL